MTAALSGLRVVEFAEGVAGPLLSRLLGDAGADVIKVELPDGDRARGWPPQADGMGAAFHTLNRNKRSVALKLTAPDSTAVDSRALLVLSGLADALIVDATMVDQAALDLRTLMEQNPGLVVCVISGWGPEGPWAERPGGELPAQLAAEATTSLGRPGDEPVRLGTEHAGIACALYGVQAVTAALLVSDQGGQRIDLSLFGSLMHMRTAMWIALSNPDEWWGFHLDSYTKPPEHFYTCKDRLVLFQVYRVDDMVALVKDLNMDFVLDDPRWELFRQDTGALGRYSDRVHDLWDRGLAQWTFEEVEPIFNRHGATIFPCLTYDEFFSDPQVRHLGIVVDTTTGENGRGRDLAPPWRMSDTPASIRSGAPRLDQHGSEVRDTIISSGRWTSTT
jgi:crotonobetainyl-CoA:carnitine CoA-transferase CaiB-like acyl-CoA transferase